MDGTEIPTESSGDLTPRLFVREMVKRFCDLCKRMQVAASRMDQLRQRERESENCCPWAVERSPPFSFFRPFDVFVPLFPYAVAVPLLPSPSRFHAPVSPFREAPGKR